MCLAPLNIGESHIATSRCDAMRLRRVAPAAVGVGVDVGIGIVASLQLCKRKVICFLQFCVSFRLFCFIFSFYFTLFFHLFYFLFFCTIFVFRRRRLNSPQLGKFLFATVACLFLLAQLFVHFFLENLSRGQRPRYDPAQS